VVSFKAESTVRVVQVVQTMEEAAAAVDAVGPNLAPFLSGFLEGPFCRNVRGFVETHAASFAVTCPDGSYPLFWTELHGEYCALFERQLNSVVQEEGFSREDFRDYIAELQQASSDLQSDEILPGCSTVRVSQFQKFSEALVASTSFERFLRVMFNVVISRQLAAGESAATQEIEVIVPEGLGPGQLMAVDFLGTRFELVVPNDCGPGAAFRATVAVPDANPV